MTSEHTSYELSKRLHELGFKAECIHVYESNRPAKPPYDKRGFTYPPDEDVYMRAYTFTELWDAMPEMLEGRYLTFIKVQDICAPCYSPGGREQADDRWSYSLSNDHKSPTEAAGLMVEWLIDNGHMVADNG